MVRQMQDKSYEITEKEGAVGRIVRNVVLCLMPIVIMTSCSSLDATRNAPLPQPTKPTQSNSPAQKTDNYASPQSVDEIGEVIDASELRDVAELQEALFREIKAEQSRYSKRQNRVTCSLIVTDATFANELYQGVEGLTFEEFLEPLAASCVEWVGGITEDQMLAEVFYQKEIAPDAYQYCRSYKSAGRKVMTQSLRGYLELAGKPVVLAEPIAAIVVRECKKR